MHMRHLMITSTTNIAPSITVDGVRMQMNRRVYLWRAGRIYHRRFESPWLHHWGSPSRRTCPSSGTALCSGQGRLWKVNLLINEVKKTYNTYLQISLPGTGLDAAVVCRQYPRHLQVERARPVPLRAQELAWYVVHGALNHHLGKEKDLSCQICKFYRRSYLVSHVNSMHLKDDNEFLCSICDRRFSRMGNLTNHERRVHGASWIIVVLL